MGYNVVHGPPVRGVANAGYIAGRGQFNLRQQALQHESNMQGRRIAASRDAQDDQQQFQNERDKDYQNFQKQQAIDTEELRQKGFEMRMTKQQEMENNTINTGFKNT